MSKNEVIFGVVDNFDFTVPSLPVKFSPRELNDEDQKASLVETFEVMEESDLCVIKIMHMTAIMPSSLEDGERRPDKASWAHLREFDVESEGVEKSVSPRENTFYIVCRADDTEVARETISNPLLLDPVTDVAVYTVGRQIFCRTLEMAEYIMYWLENPGYRLDTALELVQEEHILFFDVVSGTVQRGFVHAVSEEFPDRLLIGGIALPKTNGRPSLRELREIQEKGIKPFKAGLCQIMQVNNGKPASKYEDNGGAENEETESASENDEVEQRPINPAHKNKKGENAKAS